MLLIKTKNHQILATQTKTADSLFGRLKGLLGRKYLASNEALLITKCNSIHTCFMQFTIDVIFLDKDWRVVGLYSCLKPWRLTRIFFNAKNVIELPAGTIKQFAINLGDELSLEPAIVV